MNKNWWIIILVTFLWCFLNEILTSEITEVALNCQDDNFRCEDGKKCIPLRWKCDYVPDCHDASDEPGDCPPRTCSPGQFLCSTALKCIPLGWVCDGEVDCGHDAHGGDSDTSDEDPRRCLKGQSCPNNYFRCKDNITCKPISALCDHVRDCPDYSDEGAFCSNKTMCDGMACEYKCQPSPIGPLCHCGEGKEPNGTMCVDTDECKIEGTCDQICNNTMGSHTCNCTSGYVKDGSRCLAINVPEDEPATIIFSNAKDIQHIYLNGTPFEGNSQRQHPDTFAMDFDHRNKTACWINYLGTNSSLKCAQIYNLSDSWDINPPHHFLLGTACQLALDWISKNWYFLDDETEIIFVCNYTLEVCITLIDVGLSKPRGIALDPTRGLMFYTEWGSSAPMLEKARMDGSDRVTLVDHKIVYPYGVAVDYPNEHVYWVDTYLDYIERVDYYGRRRITVIKGTPVQNLYGITVLEQNLYVTSWREHSIVRVNKYNHSDYNTIKGNLSRPFAIHIFHRQRQPQVEHPCAINNGNCDHICITLWKSTKPFALCKCKPGFRLVASTKCAPAKQTQFLLYGKGRPGMIKGINMATGDKQQEVMVPITGLIRPTALDYDVSTQYIYYSDIQRFVVERQKVDGSSRELVIESGLNGCEGLAVDWMGKNLYWTDEALHSIFVAKIADVSKKKLLIFGNMTHPRSIVVHPKSGYMYWTDWSVGQNFLAEPHYGGKIERAGMDGSNREVLISTKLQWPNGLTIDYVGKKLFFCDAYLHKVERTNLDGTGRETLLEAEGLEHPYSLAFHDDYIYWTEFQKGKIQRANLLTKKIETLRVENPPVFELRLFNNESQIGSNPCSDNNNCVDLCLASPESYHYTCMCRDGYSLASDGVSCEEAVNYTDPTSCKENEFRCLKTHRCIDIRFLCDGDNDCGDGSDEDSSPGSKCDSVTCNKDSIKCDKSRCISVHWVCDGDNDCSDGTDESPALCKNNTCSPIQFTCKTTGRCIPKSWTCDLDNDCGEGDTSDEHADCEYPTCEESEFQCDNKRCIPTEYVCDKDDDCRDDSDERNCPDTCAEPGQFSCASDYTCLPSSLQCNSVWDCFDGSDEENCTASKHAYVKQCHSLEFQCGDGTCIRKDWRCDLVRDCTDGSDELNCVNVTCATQEFMCHDRSRCIYRGFLCDGAPDCFDGSDELECAVNSTLLCPFPSYMCTNGSKCINITKVCDGNRDCDDGSDEGLMCDNKLCKTSECSDLCRNTPNGYMCYCKPGRKLLDDKKTCAVAVACSNWGVCSQICKSTMNSHKCECLPGYQIEPDHFTCKSIDKTVPYIIFSNRHELRAVDLESHSVKAFISGLKNTIALDFFYKTNTTMIFWTDVVDDKIYHGTLIGGSLTNIEPVVQTGLATAEGLAVDWIGENLYWVESNLDQIEVAKINGSFRRTLIAGNMESPRAIALDPRYGLMFWTDWDSDAPRIESSSMSGEGRRVIFRVDKITDGAWPNGLTLDYISHRIYWIDAKSDSIHTARYDGTDHREVIRGTEWLTHPFAIALFGNNVYWTDWRSNSVVGANKWNGSNHVIIQRTITQPFDIHVMHPSRQPRDIKNPCGDNNGGCSHLCLLNFKNTFRCHCPHVMKLSDNNKTCISNERVLLFSRLNEIRGVDLNAPYHHIIPPLNLPQVISASQIDFDAKERKIYWADSQLNEVKRASLSGILIETIIDTAIAHPSGFAVDWISRNMFIVSHDTKGSSVLACTLQGEYFTRILNLNMSSPKSLAVNPVAGKLYWSEHGASMHAIRYANMDGSNLMTLTSQRVNERLSAPQSLAMDLNSNILYWVNSDSGTIQYYDFTKNTVVTLPIDSHKTRPAALTFYKNNLYYADNSNKSIYAIDKLTGSNHRQFRNNTSDILALRVYDAETQTGTNPCANNNGGCPHLCLPRSPTERTCRCAIGFTQSAADPKKCIGTSSFLLYSNNWELRGLSLDPRDAETEVLAPISKVSLASSIDFVAGDDYIYWVDSEIGNITRIHRDGTGRESVIGGLESVEGIAVDWIAGNFYWTDPAFDVIEVARFNGSHRYVVVAGNMDKPMAITINPLVGFLFWADVGKVPKIERAALDGSNRVILVNNTIKHVTDLSVDFRDSKLYWCDSQLNSISRINFDGTTREIVLHDNEKFGPFAVTLLDGYMFWVDIIYEQGSILRGNKNKPSERDIIKRGLGGDNLKDILVYHTARQSGTNKCHVNNGGCQELCFYLGNDNYTCACAYGKVAADGKTCEDYDAFIMFSRVSKIDSIHMFNESVPNSPFESIQDIRYMRNVIGLSFDYTAQRIFYSDIQRGSINSVFFNGTNHTVVVEKQGSVEGLAFERLHQVLYWTCNSDASINRINLAQKDKEAEKIVKLGTDDKPRGIAVDSCDSRMYWTNWNSRHPSIQRSYLSGYEMQNIITTDIRMPNALSIDHRSQKLYWSDARFDKIERCNLDGTKRHVILTHQPHHPFDIAIYGDYIFWTDWVLHAVLRANKYTGEDIVYLRNNVPRPMGIIAVANDADDCTQNPCHTLNAGCQDLCNVLDNETAICSCSPGRILLPDNKRCGVKLANCSDVEFECAQGVCIPYILTCNGDMECPDGSDENHIFCATRTCRDGYYHCSNNRCVPNDRVCNENNDCGDNSDEYNCTCTDSQFRCASGMCINQEYRCDYDADCFDASDEMGCPQRDCTKARIDGTQMTPSLHLINCAHTTACIHADWICDGQNDCWDNSDEKDCGNTHNPVESTSCPEKTHRCNTGRCIPISWVCDRDADCSDAINGTTSSDEQNCNYTCADDKFQCDNLACIPKTWQCDGLKDCVDGSDEGTDCQTRMCAENEFKCNHTGRCIPMPWVCDGENDCADAEASDEHPEQGCAVPLCPEDYFQCSNSRCIFKGFVCDRDNDCGDNSDEPSSCVYHPCAEDQFQCKNKVACIPRAWLCNHINECGDNSDEEDVMCIQNSTLVKCGAGKHECDNDVCIDESHLCDGQNDCGDFSDEEKCNINECEYIETVCSHKCIDKPIGYECSCFEGYRLKKDKKSCEDINECKEQYPCSHYCRNTVGSYVCTCARGYISSHNGQSCKLNSTMKPTLIFSNRYYIRQVDFSGQDTRLLTNNLTNAVALDYDWAEKCVYWSDVTALGSTLKRFCDGQVGHKVLHSATVQNPDGLAVDWIGRNLYWCDKGTDTIEVSKLDGQFRKVLIRDGLQEPRAIVLDPFDGYLYWTDWGERPYIAKVGMDGTQKKVIVNDSLGWPNALTISYVSKELFWADAREDYIAVTDLNGNSRRVIVNRGPHQALHHIFSLAVFEDYLFWTDWETKSVERCHKYKCNDKLRIATTVHRPMSIQVYHPDRQPPLNLLNPCENNGGCLALCLLQPGGKTAACGCPENYYLTEDGLNCKNNCSSNQFVCISTYKCIPFWWRCDTQDDCGDGSDEPSDCPEFVCHPGQFQCSGDKNCIHPSQLCDGNKHCNDGSDELNCDDYPCLSSQFKCSSNATSTARCIPASNRCDGQVDCPNKEDESNCPPRTCPVNHFTCKNGKCISNVWVCDRDNDCGDNSDEIDCKNRSCSENQLLCNSGRCIPLSWKCDGDHDCADGEDELLSCGGTVNITCEPSYFKCKNNRCIPGRWHCDYDDDCGDKSDEEGCKPRNCSESEFRCGNGRCIRGSWECNGEFNCEDQSDELNCRFTCSPSEFQCTKPEFCIYQEWKCDGDTDCTDGSDEVDCGRSCKAGEFSCASGECIPLLWQCDGEEDCIDSSDENIALCRGIHPCTREEFRCPNTTCIPQSKVCDGVDDCGDYSDEEMQQCQVAHGPRSSCRGNLFKCDNGRCILRSLVCDTFDDCEDNSDERDCEDRPCKFGTCSQICNKKKSGNTTCSCASGYALLLKQGKIKTCAAEGIPPYLMIASDSELRIFNLSELGAIQDILQNAHTHTNKIDSIDVFYNNGKPIVFWTNHHSHGKNIMRLSVPSMADTLNRPRRVKREDAEPVISNLQEPRGIAVDWIGKRIYWVDAGDDTISFADLDGTHRTTVITTHLDQPHDIALDPEAGKMYWTDWGIHAKIEVANMDGRDRKTLVDTGVHWPAGIAIDYPARRIYWTDPKALTIESVTLDGKDRNVVKVFSHEEDKPYKIEVFEDSIFVTTYHLNNILEMNKFGRGNTTLLVKEFRRASDIVIIQENKQNRNLTNPCKPNPCGKEAVCLTLGVGNHSCICPDGLAVMNVTDVTKKMSCAVVPTIKTTTAVPCSLICLNGGTCIFQSDNRMTCACKDSYDGERCELYRCSEYCKNRGFCYTDLLAPEVPGQKPPLKCSCPPDWTGDRCESPADVCKTFCKNGGTCEIIKGGAGAICTCPPQFTGTQCENCINYDCQNGGVCLYSNNHPKCNCHTSYSGDHCESSPCDKYCRTGKCILSTDGVRTCTCPAGYSGKHCERDQCKDYCYNGGVCRRTAKKPICDCPDGYSGPRCSSNVCDCKNSGQCVLSKAMHEFTCRCKPGYTGRHCEWQVNVTCSSNTCLNGGTCHIEEGNSKCICTSDWSGHFCQESSANLCHGYCLHGECQFKDDTEQQPYCMCYKGWIGDRCERKNECNLFCFNGGTCLPSLPDSGLLPSCLCPPGFQGHRCETSMIRPKGSSSYPTASVAGGIIAAAVIGVVIVVVVVVTVLFCMRRHRFNPFLHKRMQDSSNVEINNPMYMRGECEDDATEPMEAAFTIDPDKTTDFSNPVYDTLYSDGATGASSEEKKGLLQGDNLKVDYFDGHIRDPLREIDRETFA